MRGECPPSPSPVALLAPHRQCLLRAQGNNMKVWSVPSRDSDLDGEAAGEPHARTLPDGQSQRDLQCAARGLRTRHLASDFPAEAGLSGKAIFL